MKKLLSAVAIWAALLAPALAANVNIDGLPAAASAGGTDLLECEQSGTNRKCTHAQLAAYVYGLTSGDITINGTGAGTLATVNANVGTFGSATSCITTTQNAKGLTTAISAATCTPAIGSITGLGTGVQAALAAAMNSSTGPVGALTPTNNNCIVGNGTAWTSTTCPGGGGGVSSIASNTGAFTLNATSGITNSTNDIICSQGSASQFGCVKADNTTITAASGVLSAAPITATPSTQTGTNYAFQSTDRGKVIYLSNASNQVPTIAQAGTGGFTTGWFVTACNINAGTQTVTPTTSTIGGASTLLIPAGNAARPVCQNIVSDGTNYVLVPNSGTIFNGTLAMGTSAITAGTCGTAATVTAPGVVSTDIITIGFNADPTATTGYLPTAMLTLVPFPTANTISVKQCNLTGSSITPSALTANVRVSR